MTKIEIIDDYLPSGLLRAVAATWPKNDWPHWHRYADANSQKLASKDAHRLPDASRLAIAEMAKIDVAQFSPEAFPDLDLHGAGLHSVLPGGHLGLHLDGAVHPQTGWRREVNAVLFVDAWQEPWGGNLEFRDSEADPSHQAVTPKRNRLVLFATGNAAWHQVYKVTGPIPRRTLSLFWWSEHSSGETRNCAHFAGTT